ncbi:MAG: endonuclease/exonuclease/phosphatase family protein, partial [Actinobacteria bacterium]|nr:endonuclease/exonuclease/phosphatase family protein [Actinomycetota bacterium]
MRTRSAKLAPLALAVLALGALSGCTDDDDPAPSGNRPEIGTIELQVMTFNVWIGGEAVDFGKVIEVIEAGGADIVGLQEAEAHTQEIADRLGWYADERQQIISRFPLYAPPEGEGMYLYAQLAPGQVVAVGNTHLPSDPYGPTMVRDGEPLDAVLQNEADTRMSALEPRLEAWSALAATGMPLFVTGDFNTPSHRDWTEHTTGLLPHMKYAVEWPVTKAMEDAGFVDTFRAAHPSPTTTPGRTWTYGYPYPRVLPGEVIDRIDYVWATGAGDVIDSQVVGNEDTPGADIEVTPYPSDHRAVVSTVEVDPVEPPPFVSVDQVRVERGQTVGARYHAPGGLDTDRLVVVPEGGDASSGADGIMWLPPQEASFFGHVTFGSGTLDPGTYEVVLVTAGDAEVSRSRFWVVEPGALPSVSTPTSIAAGEPIEVSWADAPARKWDWVGIYPAGEI